MKYVIEIIEIDKCPTDWGTTTAWPGQGIYRSKAEPSYLYHVNQYSVNFIPNAEQFLGRPFADQGEAVSEALLLKAIVAASHGKVA